MNEFILQLIVWLPSFLFALSVHEFSHGYVAHKLGDPTAANLGRLTLNPLKHLDPIGVLCFFVIKIGWAKPVPVDPRYFQDPKKDMLWVSLAGPVSNFILALISGLVANIIYMTMRLFPQFSLVPLHEMAVASVWINIMLACINLVPVPPLDGSKIVIGLLPTRLAIPFSRIEPYGFIVLLLLIYSGILPKIMFPLIFFAQNLLMW